MIRRLFIGQRIVIRTSNVSPILRKSFPAATVFSSNRFIAPTTDLRCYSTDPESSEPSKNEKNESSQETETAHESKREDDPIIKELEAKKKEVFDLKDRYLRSVADFRNLQERTKRDMQAARDFAIQKFAKDLIESVDNLDRALSIVPKEKLTNPEASEDRKELISLYEGLRMTEDILMNTLKKNGLERFDPSVDGEKFNPNEHEATFMVPMEGKENNTVFNTQQKGFKLHGRVLRAAKVGVVKNS